MKANLSVFYLVFLVTACAHKSPPPSECPPCKDKEARAEVVRLEKSLEGVGRESTDCADKLAKCQKSGAFMDRWRESFSAMSALIQGKLDESEEIDEDDEETENARRNEDFEELDYKLEFLNGNLMLTFSNDVFFNRGKPGLTSKGKEILGLISEVFQEIEGHKVTIGCRSTAAQEHQSRTKWLSVRELSAKRAVAIMAEMEKNGVEPRNLAAASLSNRVEEDPMERGTTVFIIAPSPRELPRYPDKP